MSEIDVMNIKFRASQAYKIMTNPKDKSAEIGQTTITYLSELYRELKYGRRQVVTTKVLEKGHQNEENGITLASRLKQVFFKKNEERIFNPVLSGTPDLIPANEDIKKVSEGFDIKCSWSLDTFPFKVDKLPDIYRYQAMCYMALTGAKKWTIIYCLTNNPAYQIVNAKRQLWFAMGCPEQLENSKNVIYNRYKESAIMIERNMIFDIKEFINDNPNYDFESPVSEWAWDIPMKERMVEFVVMRDEDVIKSIYARVHKCRAYMAERINKGEW